MNLHKLLNFLNNMVDRILSDKIKQMSGLFPSVTLTGPRQSGKSTLLRNLFPDYRYVSLEDLDMRMFATEDPRGFLSTYDNHVILDEAQRVPSLFSYLQTHMDSKGETGMYMIAGSQNFSLMDAIDQSLAGRTAILRLLPFSREELHLSGMLPPTIDSEIFTGSYPRIFDKGIMPQDYYPSYIQTYVQRDVRQISNIVDLNRFVRVVRLLAGRIGQMLNVSSLATESGVSASAVESWISVLEASYICYRLEPNYNNYNKRIVKTPKIYFYDTGLACNLLGITSESQVATHYLRGGLYENLVINEFLKSSYNRGENPDITFWRDSSGLEVDLVQTRGGDMYGYEIKSGSTFNKDFFRGLQKWAVLSSTPADRLNVIYNGETPLKTSSGRVIPFPSTFALPEQSI